ncbi:uncharacterized protein LOC141627908 [Silene latifolia]|uniref:uncharacterized protein LOC141627908 n=1 Tax=Silene latifolia TaxID=37657 RepID=UPI003D76EEC6
MSTTFHAATNCQTEHTIQMLKCRSPLCWDDSSEAAVLGPELVQESIEHVRLIREKLKAAQDQQKTYAELRHRPIELEVGDKVFLKVLPMKGVKRFRIKGKLSPKYFGPYEVLERVREVAYRLALPPNLSKLHDVFHVSQLCHYRSDPSHVLQADVIEVEPNLTYEEQPVRILERQEKRLRNKVVPLVRALRRS